MPLPKQREIHDVLIAVLAELGGEALPRKAYPAVTARFPQIEPNDLTETLPDGRTNRWTNRIQWARQDLVLAGYLHRGPRGLWRLTERGLARARGEPEPQPIDVTPANDTEVPPPDILEEPPTPVPLRSKATGLVDVLLRSEHASSRPQDYESAVGEVFAFLGFYVEHIGGSGDTDLVAYAPLGVGGYELVIDAKTTASGRVSEAQINWPAIEDHRKRRGADYAVVVGPGFAGGHLLSRAAQFEVTLLTTHQLVSLVEVHEKTPFTLDELRPIFARRAEVDSASLNELFAASQQTARRWVLLGCLIDQIGVWSRLQPELVLAQPMTLFSSLLGNNDERLRGLTPDEVEDGLAVLSSAAVGVLRKVSNGGEGFVLTTTPAGARQRLLAVGRAVAAAQVTADAPSEAVPRFGNH